MPEDLLHKILFALLSGLTEFLPVSSSAHQKLYCLITGFDMTDGWLMLSIHLGALIAVLLGCKTRLKRLSRENRVSRRKSSRRKIRQPDPAALLDMRVLKTAAIPILISVLFYNRAGEWITGTAPLALVLAINGFLLFMPRLMNQGNKDGRAMSRMDSVLMGLGGCIAAIPGLSRVGGITTAGLARGGDRVYVLDMALLLSIPTLLGLLLLDIYYVAAAGVGLTFLAFLVYLLTAALSFAGGYIGVIAMRFLSVKTGFTGFSYYCWGMALFSFILYLMI